MLGVIKTEPRKQKEGTVNIYVGNLSFDATEEDVREVFEAFGKVESAKIVQDKYSGRSRGFGFVEMPSEDEAKAAISGLNGKEVKGRALSVNEARPRSEKPRGGGGGGRGRGRDDRY
jgi:RNA recognition motif-containing protein